MLNLIAAHQFTKRLIGFQVKKRVPLQGEELEKYLEEEKEKAKEKSKKQANIASAKR